MRVPCGVRAWEDCTLVTVSCADIAAYSRIGRHVSRVAHRGAVHDGVD